MEQTVRLFAGPLIADSSADGRPFLYLILFWIPFPIALVILSFTTYTFLQIVQSTAMGKEEVTWTEDGSGGGWLEILLLLALCLAPPGLVLMLAVPGIWFTHPQLVFLLAALELWLCFPIIMLSLLTGSSSWVFVRWSVLAGLVRILPTTCSFYLASLPLILGGTAGWVPALGKQPGYLPVAAILGSASLLVYARLLGRLAWLMADAELRYKTPGNSEAAITIPPPQPGDPSCNTPVRESTSDLTGEIKEKPMPPQATQLFQPIQVRLEQDRARLQMETPPRSLWEGVWNFPFSRGGRLAWLGLALAGLGGGVLVQVVVLLLSL
jgi:hypothetical protein